MSVRQKIDALLFDFVTEHGPAVALTALSHEHALGRILSRTIDIRTTIDVGASDGHWAAMAQKRFWPEASFLLIEAYDVWQERLEKRKRSCPRLDYVIAAAGDQVGRIYLCKRPDHPTGGHAYHRKIDDRYEEVPQTTIDFEVADKKLQGPFMVKLDCHGREREILLGAEHTLRQTNLLLIETYNFADRGRMLFHEVCTFVEERGFRCIDIAEPFFREQDQSFWQIDLFFIRADRPEFSDRKTHAKKATEASAQGRKV